MLAITAALALLGGGQALLDPMLPDVLPGVLPAGPTRAAAAGRRPRRRQVGWSTRLGGETFRIWGGRRTGIMPKGVSVSPDGKRVFVTNFGRRRGRNVDVYDARSLRPLHRASYPGNAIESVVSPDSRTLYVTNYYGFVVQALDTRSWKIRWSQKVGRFPKMLALSPEGKRLYVSSWESGTASWLDPATGRVRQTSGRLGYHPRGVSLHPDGKTVYVAITGGRHVVALDATSLKEKHRIRTAGMPRHTVISGDGSRLYVSTLHHSLLQVIDTRKRKVVRSVHLGGGPRTVALSRDERFVYVAAYIGHGLVVVDTHTWKKRRIPLDIVKGSGVAVRPDDRFIYVTGWCSKDLWVVERLGAGQTGGALGRPPKRRRRLIRDPRTAGRLDCPRPRRRPHRRPPRHHR